MNACTCGRMGLTMVAECPKMIGVGRALPTLADPFTMALGVPTVQPQHILRTLEFKLYPTAEQADTLTRWLSKCCWLYNQCLEQRIKAYKRRQESVSFNAQCALLTGMRDRIESVCLVPVFFARSALHRLDRGMKAFFRRVKAGEKPGFPRFRSWKRYNSIECLAPGKYICEQSIYIPKLGMVRARGRFDQPGTQKLLRVIRRASGWYAQVVVEQPLPAPLPPTGEECGIDLGLEAFATLDDGERIANPRTLRKSAKKLKRAQQRLSRCVKGSNRRKVAVRRVARLHEKVGRKRLGFAHRVSRDLVNRFDRIGVEALNVKGLAAGMLAKSVHDAGWGIFLFQLRSKAESAGRVVVEVNPSGTSQECPRCGAVARKELSERTHRCKGCGLECHRDVAAAMVIRQRAFRPARGEPIAAQ